MTLLDDQWLLPEGVEETLPPHALALERARRQVLDLCWSWGYDLVIPPFIEHLENLLTGTGSDLALETFKLTDPASGRLIGVRADMTPQVARIDAHHFDPATVRRLCYLGTVLLTGAESPGGSRSPVQLGAELYGHAGIEGDFEVLTLMLATLDALGVEDVHLDLGHVGVFRALVGEERLSARAETRLLEVLQRKTPEDVDEALSAIASEPTRRRVRSLIGLNGGREVLARAREVLAGAGERVLAAVSELEALVELLDAWGVDRPLHFDLAELRGYAYHTGVVFAALVPGQGQEVARGGRYDDIGLAFGARRAATGFSTDLKQLVALADAALGVAGAIAAPWRADPELRRAVCELRRRGERVVNRLPGARESQRCDRRLAPSDGRWVVLPNDEDGI